MNINITVNSKPPRAAISNRTTIDLGGKAKGKIKRPPGGYKLAGGARYIPPTERRR